MSNPIRYDSLLVRYLASELAGRLDGRPCQPAFVRHGDRAAVLPLDRGEALHFDLHPRAGWIRLLPWPQQPGETLPAEVAGVENREDERWLSVRIRGGTRFRPVDRRLVVELHANHWNLLLLDSAERIVGVLNPRDAGGRTLRPGENYLPPRPRPRLLPSSVTRKEAMLQWERCLSGASVATAAREVQQNFAYLGPVNVGPVLGAAARADAPPQARREAFERWWGLALHPPSRPVLLHTKRGPQPYPLSLAGIAAEPMPDLLTAMAAAAEAEPAPEFEGDAASWAPAIEARLRSARARVARLRENLAATGDAERARHFGDLLLANLAAVPRGVGSVRLQDWEGNWIEIPLDPAAAPAENATRWYDVARRDERTAERIPALLEAAEAEVERWERHLAEAATGSVPEPVQAELRRSGRAAADPAHAERLAYRVYRTSGGLEVRVGRGSADNDRLTFGHSRPDDVWLHARSVPGSHVILRWGSAEHAPPARDLAEAAGLAAWFSKARTSGLVAVDWTRRKHVRKPRGAAPGAVIPQRVKTLFVEPDPNLEARLSDGFVPDETSGAAG